MAALTKILEILFDIDEMKAWGKVWRETIGTDGKAKKANCFDKKQGMDFGKFIDPVIANALSQMLGGISIEKPTNNKALIPPKADCVEIGDTKVIGGVRSQNFDLVYRPDGIRIAYDSKTLNDEKSIMKNWNNMINDLTAEATTVHTRFPYALVLFFIVIPKAALKENQAADIIRTLERMNERIGVQEENHKAESVALVIWDTETGEIDSLVPEADSSLRLEKFGDRVEDIYISRYKGLPPHDR